MHKIKKGSNASYNGLGSHCHIDFIVKTCGHLKIHNGTKKFNLCLCRTLFDGPLLNLLPSAKILEQINYHLGYNWASNNILHLGQDGAIAWISKMNWVSYLRLQVGFVLQEESISPLYFTFSKSS
jgi:hypothetical protein